MQDDDMGGAWYTHGKSEKSIRRFLAVKLNIKRKYADPDVRRIIILNGILKK